MPRRLGALVAADGIVFFMFSLWENIGKYMENDGNIWENDGKWWFQYRNMNVLYVTIPTLDPDLPIPFKKMVWGVSYII